MEARIHRLRLHPDGFPACEHLLCTSAAFLRQEEGFWCETLRGKPWAVAWGAAGGGSCIPMSPGSLQPRGGAPGLDGGGLEQQRVWCSPCAAMVCQAPAGCRLSVLSPGRHQGAPAPNCFSFWYYEQNTRYMLRLGKTFIFLRFPVALLCCLVRLDVCPTCSEFVTSVDCLSCCRTCGRRREEAGKGYFFEKSF